MCVSGLVGACWKFWVSYCLFIHQILALCLEVNKISNPASPLLPKEKCVILLM